MASSEAEEKFCLAKDMVVVCVGGWVEGGKGVSGSMEDGVECKEEERRKKKREKKERELREWRLLSCQRGKASHHRTAKARSEPCLVNSRDPSPPFCTLKRLNVTMIT